MPFGMNFTSVRVDTGKGADAGASTSAARGAMSVHGVSEPNDDPDGLRDVTEIHIVVHGGDEEQPALHARLVKTEPTWSVTIDPPVPYTVRDVVFVVGVALRASAEPFVWFNRVTIMDITDRIIPPSGA